jgi:hypothetical protein
LFLALAGRISDAGVGVVIAVLVPDVVHKDEEEKKTEENYKDFCKVENYDSALFRT